MWFANVFPSPPVGEGKCYLQPPPCGEARDWRVSDRTGGGSANELGLRVQPTVAEPHPLCCAKACNRVPPHKEEAIYLSPSSQSSLATTKYTPTQERSL